MCRLSMWIGRRKDVGHATFVFSLSIFLIMLSLVEHPKCKASFGCIHTFLDVTGWLSVTSFGCIFKYQKDNGMLFRKVLQTIYFYFFSGKSKKLRWFQAYLCVTGTVLAFIIFILCLIDLAVLKCIMIQFGHYDTRKNNWNSRNSCSKYLDCEWDKFQPSNTWKFIWVQFIRNINQHLFLYTLSR